MNYMTNNKLKKYSKKEELKVMKHNKKTSSHLYKIDLDNTRIHIHEDAEGILCEDVHAVKTQKDSVLWCITENFSASNGSGL